MHDAESRGPIRRRHRIQHSSSAYRHSKSSSCSSSAMTFATAWTGSASGFSSRIITGSRRLSAGSVFCRGWLWDQPAFMKAWLECLGRTIHVFARCLSNCKHPSRPLVRMGYPRHCCIRRTCCSSRTFASRLQFAIN